MLCLKYIHHHVTADSIRHYGPLFLIYCKYSWPKHALHCLGDVRVNQAALTLLNDAEKMGLCYDGASGLHIASREGLHHLIDDIYSHSPLSLNKFWDGCTPLVLACRCNHTLVVERLLSKPRVRVNAVHLYNHEYAFYYAPPDWPTRHCRDKFPFNRDPRKGKGRSALMYAALRENKEIAALLVGMNNINLNHRDTDGRTALNMAESCKALEVVKVLMECGKTVDVSTWRPLGNRGNLYP
jgi:FOG: Ankyrin repeat